MRKSQKTKKKKRQNLAIKSMQFEISMENLKYSGQCIVDFDWILSLW